MTHVTLYSLCTVVVLSGCAVTQNPVSVSDSGGVAPVVAPVAVAPTVVQTPLTHADPAPRGASAMVPVGLGLDKLPAMAKSRQKNPAGLKHYVGQSLHGQAKFVKTAKGNPNALVADVRINGLGEVSLWCRNVLGESAAGRMAGFDGVLTGEVYTSEDFSNDVYLKDCRFRD